MSPADLRTVAALYVDRVGPYASMPGVEMWDEQRDARLYAGPHPVVAHRSHAERMTSAEIHLTPKPFAEFLVGLARRVS